MRVLVDTSVWIEYFRPRPRLPEDLLGFLTLLIEDDRAATIYPIQTELLSGNIFPQREKEIREAFEAMPHIDPNWNDPENWEELVKMARIARRRGLPIPGVVDRMILRAAEKEGASLWTFDQALKRLASEISVRLF